MLVHHALMSKCVYACTHHWHVYPMMDDAEGWMMDDAEGWMIDDAEEWMIDDAEGWIDLVSKILFLPHSTCLSSFCWLC